MSRKIHITGVQTGRGPNNQTPVRMEITEFLKNADFKNLFLLGLESLMKKPQSDMKSWYQIAGIHGRPYTPWDGEAGTRGKEYGYCTHSSVLFLTWHRPYLALMEQTLVENILEVVAKFPAGAKKDRLQKAAQIIRLPYWDWAINASPHPIFTQKTVSVEKPTGTVTVDNPLYSYKFTDIKDFQEDGSSLAGLRETVRYPNSRGQTQDNQFARIGTTLQTKRSLTTVGGQRGPAVNLRERIWHLLNLQQERTFQAFSNDRWNRNGLSSDYDSLESVHNSLHVWIGGGGHMNEPDYAGFDPIFWLHHANVDRIYALWQALHPNADLKWEFGEAQITTTWFIPGPEEEDTPLKPFHKNNTQYWNSNECRDFKIFGYCYPELQEWNVPGVSRQALSSKVAAMVRNLYANQTTSGSLLNATQPSAQSSPFISLASMPTAVPPVEEKPIPAAPAGAHKQNPLQAAASAASKAAAPVTGTVKAAVESVTHAIVGKLPNLPIEKIVKNNCHREYFANIKAPKYAFNGPFAVYVFMGDFTADKDERPYDPNLVGSVAVFANDIRHTGCGKCQDNREAGLEVTGSVPLTSALMERMDEVGSLDKEDVEQYLTKNLHWRIHSCDIAGENIDRRNADGVLLTVTSVIVEHPSTPGGIPVYRDWNPIPGITAGRPGGADYNNAEGYEV